MRRRVTYVGENTEAAQETTTLHLISSLNSFYAYTTGLCHLLWYVAQSCVLGVSSSVCFIDSAAVAEPLRFIKTLKQKNCPQSRWPAEEDARPSRGVQRGFQQQY